MTDYCDAILEFEDKKMCMCELDKDHEGNHRALMFEWQGEGTTKALNDDGWFRGLNLLKMRARRFMKNDS